MDLRKRKFIFNLSLTVFLGLIITLPLIGMSVNKTNSEEKRTLSPLPHLTLTRAGLKAFPQQFETYFNDHFGFRPFFLKTYHRGFYYLFKQSGSAEVIAGKQGWLFFANDKCLEDLQGGEQFTHEEKENWNSVIQERGAWLEAQGIKYFFVVPPDKHNVYPEYLPYVYRQHASSRLQGLLAYVKSNPYVISLLPALKEKKQSAGDALYLHTDTHWTFYGAYIAYKAIMDSLGKDYLADSISMDDKDFRLSKVDRLRRDLAIMAGLKQKESDWEPSVHQTFKEAAVLLPYGFEPYYHDSFFATYNPTKTKTLLVIHDSFGHKIKPYLSSTFRRVVYFNGRVNSEQFVQLVRQERPDVVLEVRVERSMQYVPSPDLAKSIKKMQDPLGRRYTDEEYKSRIKSYDLILKNAQLVNTKDEAYLSVEGKKLDCFTKETPENGHLDELIKMGDHYLAKGWAAFVNENKAADYVALIANNKIVFIGKILVDRPDVSNFYNKRKIARSGFNFLIPSRLIDGAKGQLRFVALKGEHYGFISKA